MLRVSKLELKEALDFVKCARGKDEYRPVLTGIHLYLKAGRLCVETVDGYRMMQTSIEILESDFQQDELFDCIFDYNMPIKATKKEVSAMNIDLPDEKTVSFTDVLSGQNISYKIIQGEFINTESLWPTEEPEYQILLNAQYLANLGKAFQNGQGILLSFYGATRPVIASLGHDSLKNTRGLVLPLRD